MAEAMAELLGRAHRLDALLWRRLTIAICTDEEGDACLRIKAAATC